MRWYREHGYNFLVLTDHNYLTAVDGLNAVHGAADKFIVVRGEEVTSTASAKAVHVNGLNVDALVKQSTSPSVVVAAQENVDGIRRANGDSAHQPSELHLGDHDRRSHAGAAHAAVRDLQRPSAGQQRGRRRVAGPRGDLGSSAQQRPPDVRRGRGRCPSLQETGGSARVRARARLGVRPRGTAGGAALVEAMERGDFYASTGVELASYEATASAISLREGDDLQPIPRAVHRPERPGALGADDTGGGYTFKGERATSARACSNRTAIRRGRSRCRWGRRAEGVGMTDSDSLPALAGGHTFPLKRRSR